MWQLPRPKRRDYVCLTHAQVLTLAAEAGCDPHQTLLSPADSLRARVVRVEAVAGSSVG